MAPLVPNIINTHTDGKKHLRHGKSARAVIPSGGCGLSPPTLFPSARPSLRQGNNRGPLFPFDEGGHSTAGELFPAPASWIMVPHGRGRDIPAFGKLVSKPQPPNHSRGLPPDPPDRYDPGQPRRQQPDAPRNGHRAHPPHHFRR